MMDWEQAEHWLKEIESMYTEIGSSGTLTLIATINPLRDRFNKGERSQELFNEIMELE